MAYSKMVKPAVSELVPLTVQRTERLSPGWMRVTLGGAEIDRFQPMGYDQWVRLFLPIGGESGLGRVPAKANRTLGYLRFLRIPDGERPVMRNYTIRAFREATPDAAAELDIDFVLHGSAADGTSGPAAHWAETCRPGDNVLIIDEGLAFNPQRGVDSVVLVGDETALPAIAGICASLPDTATGIALVEAPSEDDALVFPHPPGVEVRWIVREAADRPGARALGMLRDAPLPTGAFHAYVAGEQALASGGRRLLVSERGADRNQVSFCGYWKLGAASPASRAARDAAERKR